MIEDWKKDVLTEKSLHQVYLVSRSLPKSPFNRFVYFAVAGAIAVIVVVWLRNSDVENSAKLATEIANLGFDLTVQILGFLIGGFAIFATVTDPRLMKRLAQAPMPNSNLSVFKTVFFNFLSVFYIYVLTLALSLVVRLCGNLDTVNAADVVGQDQEALTLTILNSTAFAVLAFLCAMAVVRLKSFIWNIYQAFLTFLAVSEAMEREEQARREERASADHQTGAQ